MRPPRPIFILPRMLGRGTSSRPSHRAARIGLASGGAALVLAMSLLLSSRPSIATSQLDPAQRTATSERRGSASLGKLQPPRRSTLYWGAWIGKGLTGEAAPWDMGAVRAYERMVRKPLSIVQWGSPFANCETSPCTPYPFPVTPMNDVRQYGAIPFLSWGAQSIPVDPNRPGDLPDYQLSDLIAGRHDDYIRSFASKAREWGHPFFLRFNWEPNSDWFPWAIKANGNRPNEYVTAWRHVHNIFSSVGAENATWVWCPYVDFKNEYNLRALYPGSRFVDWTCLDGYNWGRRNPANPRPWRSFDELFRTTYRRVVRSIAPRKPMILAELATSNHAGRKGAWLRDMLATLPRDYPKVRGFIYFNENDRNAGWEIESSPAAISAFRRGIQRPAYLANRYGQIDRSPIQPPARR